jgi:ABC-2 type transport system permease protein
MNTGRFTKFTVYFIVVVLLNIAGITLFFRADLTANQVYSLSAASRNVVATLSEPLTVKVFFNSNLPAPYNNIERYLHDLLEEYAVAGKNYFNYQFYNVSGEEDQKAELNQDLAESYGIHPVQIQNIEQDEVKFQKAYMGMVLIHGDVIETIPTITATEGLEYQITSSIQKMNNKISALLRLKEPVAIKLFLSSSLRAVGPYLNITGLSGLPEKIKEMVEKLNAKNYGKLSFTSIDPGMSPDAAAEADKYHILKLNWDEFTDRQGQRIPADSGYAGIVVEHGGEFGVIKLIEVIRLPIFGTQYQLAEMDGLEKTIDEMVENVININEEIGYLADHGTLPLGSVSSMFGREQDNSISNLNKLLSQRYSIKPVHLKKGGIPDGLSFLMIAGPKENFSDYELYQIDQFLMQGKTLALFLDSFNEVMPQGQQGMMQFQRPFTMPLNTGLDKLLSHYGITVKKSIVLDENSFKQRVPRAFGGGERKIYYAPIIKNQNINKDVAFLKNIKGLVFLKTSPLSIDDTKIKDEGLSAVKLLSSSDRSWEMKGRIDFNPMLMSPPSDKDAFMKMPLAYTVEGPFTSYFADKPIPEKNEEKGEAKTADSKAKAETKQEGADMSAVVTEGATIKKGKPGRIFIVGTSAILQDNVIDEEGNTPNAQFVMNVIDSLNGNEDIAVMRSKTQEFNPLKEVSPAVKTTIKTANIAGLPVLVILAGVLVWFRRAARKRMIQRMFAK